MRYSIEDFATLDNFFRRNLINSLTGFKSLNLVGTKSKENITNLAPFSQVFHIGASPALVGLLVRPDTVERHTLQNIIETESFTLNHVKEEFYKEAHQTSARYQISEFEATGLTPEYTEKVFAPYLKESVIKIGLKLEEKHNLAINGTILVIGSIQEIFLPDIVISDDGFIDLQKAGTITCVGLDAYYRTQKIARLSYAKPDKPISPLTPKGGI